MSWLLQLTLIFLLPLGTLLTLLANWGRKWRHPPGPPALPIIGHIRLARRATHRELAALANRYAGGCGLLHLRLGSLRTLTISSPAMARLAFQNHDAIFSNRPASAATRYLTYGRADMAFANYGPFWRQMRKLCVTKLFGRSRAKSWAAARWAVSSTVDAVAAQSGRPLNIGDMIFTLARNIVFSAAFGYQSCNDCDDELIRIVQEFSKLFGAFNIGDFFPWLSWLDLNGVNKRAEKARLELDFFIDKIIDAHLRNPKDGDDINRDMIDEMLDFYKSEDSTGNLEDLKSLKISRINIKAIIMDIIFGGIETVASTIEWTMTELMRWPDERRRVQNELAGVVGIHRHLKETDLDKLAYMKCVVKEALRLHPPIPLITRETTEDVVLDGRFIPARTHVRINVWAIGRDGSAWKDPNDFRPSRFVIGVGEAAGVDFRGSFFELIPFGSGRRSCPGMQLGLHITELALAELMHCFDWELPDGMKPSELGMDDVFGLTAPRASRLIAVPTLRQPCLSERFNV